MRSYFSREIELIVYEFCKAMVFSMCQIATALGVREELIQEWINDEKFPEPIVFRNLYLLIGHHSGMKVVQKLVDDLLVLPLEQITPLHGHIEGFRQKGDCRNLNDYLVLLVFDGFLRQLRCLNGKQFEVLLFETAKKALSIKN